MDETTDIFAPSGICGLPRARVWRSARLLAFLLLVFSVTARAQLRVVNYNTAGDARTGLSEILAAIGVENVNGIAKPIDVLTLQEQTTSASTTQAIVNLLNSIYGPGVYARATLDGATSGGGRPGLIYNTTTVQFIGQTAVGTVANDGAARQTLRYQLRPMGYDSAADFFVFSSHYKASNDDVSAGRRNVEALQVRSNADALGSAHIIYAGDFNIYSSDEAMYQTLLSPGNGQAFDPLNRPGAWSNSSAFKDVHTQSPVTMSRYGGQVTGGMDDRFDFQLVTGEMLDAEGLSYIAGSYRAFGNTGTHSFNGEIGSGSALALQQRLPGYSAQQASSVLTALENVSDHLPVVADYQVPAVLNLNLGAVPTRILRGATASISLEISNGANVVSVSSADELEYSWTTTGRVSGSGNGTDDALGGSNVHSVSVDTSIAGAISGSIRVQSSSQGAANRDQTRSISLSVVDHAQPSFDSILDRQSLVLDFGSAEIGDDVSLSLQIYNLISVAGFTSALDLDQISFSGDTGAFSSNLQLFTGLLAGGNHQFSFAFEPERVGDFLANYRLVLSDENLLGEQTHELNITLRGTAIPEASVVVLLLSGVLVLTRRPIRRNRIVLSHLSV